MLNAPIFGTRASASRLFDSAVVASGGALGLWAVADLLVHPGGVAPGYLLFVPLIMVMGWFPMFVGRMREGGLEIGLDACVLVFLAASIDLLPALAIWALGTTLGQVFSGKRVQTWLFNSGLSAIAGGLALLVIDGFRPFDLEQHPSKEFGAVVLGALVYFAVDLVVSAVSLHLDEDVRLSGELRRTGTMTGMVAFVAVALLGYLGALVIREPPSWAGLLLAVPIATIVVASQAQSRAAEQSRRLQVLLDAAAEVQAAADGPTLLEALRVGATDLLQDPRVRLQQVRPKPDEIGVEIRGTSDSLWIVGPVPSRVRSRAEEDRQALDALVAFAEDAFARLHLSAAMSHLAWHDPLTGLVNRALFMNRVEHGIGMQDRRPGRLAVLFCDLDGFKRVNDLFGHGAGDELLVEVAARIKASVRGGDTVARLGGDEFAVLLPDIADAGDVTLACERILKALLPRMRVGGEEVSVSITIGVALSDTASTADALLTQADLAMYHAKSRGKNRFETYRLSFGDERLHRIELVETLRTAVEDQQLEVVYQPVVSLRDHQIVGVEALVRWRRPDGVLVSPDSFIPTAEESGLIVGLGETVLDIVAAEVPALRAAAGRQLSISVNVSAQQLVREDFTVAVHAARARMGDVNLILEVTERHFVHDDTQIVEAMEAMTAAGVRFAIDDFGVGFSSIDYLRRLPVRILKVDKSFLANVENDPLASSLIGSVVVMGEALGLDVVVEGIERESQLTLLREDARASFGQGFLFGTPMPSDETAALLFSLNHTAYVPEITPRSALKSSTAATG